MNLNEKNIHTFIDPKMSFIEELDSTYAKRRMLVTGKVIKYYQVGPFYTRDSKINIRALHLLSKLATHFTDKNEPDKICVQNILYKLNTKKFGISLRMLDWLLTNYTKEYNVGIIRNDGSFLNIGESYKTALSEYRRNLFDTFRRLKPEQGIVKIFYKTKDFETGELKEEYTTVGQLNFVKWAYKNGILQYAKNNVQSIQRHNEKKSKESSRRKNQSGENKKKRMTLTDNIMQQCVIYNIPTVVSFDN